MGFVFVGMWSQSVGGTKCRAWPSNQMNRCCRLALFSATLFRFEGFTHFFFNRAASQPVWAHAGPLGSRALLVHESLASGAIPFALRLFMLRRLREHMHQPVENLSALGHKPRLAKSSHRQGFGSLHRGLGLQGDS